jgi:hypothetical protein
MLWCVNFPSTQNKSRLKQSNCRLPIPQECVSKHLINNEIFNRFVADDSRNPEYFPSNRDLPIPTASSDEATGAAL